MALERTNVTSELVRLSLAHAPSTGLHATALPSLHIVRADRRQPRVYSLFRPSLCFVVQGAKEVAVGGETFRYRGGEHLFSSVELPMTGEVVKASEAEPYLCLVLSIEPSEVFELVSMTPPSSPRRERAAIFVGKSDASIADALVRLLRCLDEPLDARVLAPGIVREITYRLLLGPYGDAVREVGVAGGQVQRIAQVIEQLKNGYDKPLRAEALARVAGMSLSSFHQHFKRVTTLSPLQYQKQLRLQEARRLLLTEAAGAADVAFRVGYESASQFSREYARMFGLPPMSDVKRTLAERAREAPSVQSRATSRPTQSRSAQSRARLAAVRAGELSAG